MAGDDIEIEPFWRDRTRYPVNEAVYKTPAELWEAACEAFDWMSKHPLREQHLFHHKGHVTYACAKKMRSFTWEGLYLHIGITRNGFQKYRTREGFEHVIEMIEHVIYAQKFEGAAAGLLNSSLVARSLGLADRSELSGPNGGPIQTEEVDAKSIILDRLARLAQSGAAGGDTGESE